MASLDFEIDLKYVKHLKCLGCFKLALENYTMGKFSGSCHYIVVGLFLREAVWSMEKSK